jgi:hypothetical protein
MTDEAKRGAAGGIEDSSQAASPTSKKQEIQTQQEEIAIQELIKDKYTKQT